MNMLAAIGILMAYHSTAAVVEGTVRLSNGKPAANAAVWLDGAVKSTPLPKHVIDQRDRMFQPHMSIIPVNTLVEFPNNDTVYHNVFAELQAERFDLGVYPRGKKVTKKFTKPGLVMILCSIHAEMSAFMMVVDTPFYGLTDTNGNFSIKGVTPGDYQLRVWHESRELAEKSITVGNARVKVDLSTARK